MRNALLLPVVLLCITGSGWASEVFDYTPNWSCNMPGSLSNMRLTSVLLNDDLFPDLVVGNLDSNLLMVYLGNGDGTFELSQQYEISHPIWIETADLDGDLDEEVIVRFTVSSGVDATDSIAVFFNQQDGTLSNPITSAGGLGAVPVMEAGKFEHVDFTGDGITDLLISHRSGPIEILVGIGLGFFQSEILYSGLMGARALDLGDVDSDEDLDIVVLDYGVVSVLLNDGTGNLTLSGSYGYLPCECPIGSLELVDLNMDGDLDIVTAPGAAIGTLSIYAFLGDGEGGFVQVEESWHPYGNIFCHATIDDYNLDGIPDAFFHGECGHQLLLGDGQGEFTDDYYYHSAIQCWEAAVGDFDLDGDLDYATATKPISMLKLNIFLNKTITNGIEQQEGNPSQPTLTLLSSPVISTASIAITLSEPSSCQLQAFDLRGRRVTTILDGPLPLGTTELLWDTGNLSPGCYLLRLDTSSGESVAFRCVVID